MMDDSLTTERKRKRKKRDGEREDSDEAYRERHKQAGNLLKEA